MTDVEQRYAALARDLADVLMLWARNRHTDDQKEIGRLQSELCRLRRIELKAQEPSEEE